MKILHIAPNSPYNDYWGYQDNLLPKYHKKLGHDVTIIVPNKKHQNGKIIETECSEYILRDGVKVIRLKINDYKNRIITNLNSKLPVYEYVKKINPDFIFFHGLLSTTIFDVIKYKKKINPSCVVVQDNHLDYNIGRGVETFKDRMIRQYYRLINKKSIKYIERVYGVTPWRKIYAEDYFKIPKNKTDVLIMGADDEKIDFFHKDSIREKIRQKYKISKNDFLIVTGGKIDSKKKIHYLMTACSGIPDVKLLIFGSVSDEIKSLFNNLCLNNKNIIYIGWIDSDKVYNIFFASDLVFFPGQHSVLWEQACASKVPCVFEYWKGMDHVNNGGNSDFIHDVSVSEIRQKIKSLKYTKKYYDMKKVAESSATDIYLYSNIAQKSLECVKNEDSVNFK